MKIIGLLLGSFVLILLLAPAPAQAQWCQDIDGAYWCGDPDACEAVCSEPGSDCTTACVGFGGNWTTCGGGGGNDNDGDGIFDDSDNCACTANANQADCDEDGWGDACDPANEKWVQVTFPEYCDWDMDWHFGYGEVEKYGTVRYRNQCGGSYCNDTVKLDDKKCYGIFDDDVCCQENYGADCAIDNQCPADNCPF